MFFKYPHSSMQDMNLDWLLKVGKQADKDHEAQYYVCRSDHGRGNCGIPDFPKPAFYDV